ncbi:glycine-rich protein 5-like [Andrographis paniculata]|uniref:glycine-rich protein 5-like n=1 Tax=Andrographis paniculata TaxID=175694 RepID=UPI0021E71B07|nr:glycine-rich protein 5-like [Andrographis paniculata]
MVAKIIFLLALAAVAGTIRGRTLPEGNAAGADVQTAFFHHHIPPYGGAFGGYGGGFGGIGAGFGGKLGSGGYFGGSGASASSAGGGGGGSSSSGTGNGAADNGGANGEGVHSGSLP